ncbi:MAG: MFS transporter [Propionibacteriaceae bacterium]|nr:MFS transporter [Propionibacteriaceae bacterium]
MTLCLFLAGLATFALLYVPQPLLPELVAQFQVTATSATLAVSLGTLGLGVALLLAGPSTELWGRTPLMLISLFASSAVGIACALAPTWEILLGLRLLQGFTLAGLPAVATAYLREEVHASASSRATGLYIGGTAIGGMSGRLIVGAVTDLLGWRLATATIGLVGLACAVVVLIFLPRSRNFRPLLARPSVILKLFARAVSDPALLALYGISGTLMGGFVAVYNAMGFRLAEPPYALPLSLASLVFASYAIGSFSSSYAGRLADRHGHRSVVPWAVVMCLAGLTIMMARPLPVLILGMVVMTAGFFAAHGVASGWVAARSAARGGGAGQAASLYLFAYYLGSSIFGGLVGGAWDRFHWTGVTALVAALWLVALGLALLLRRIKPIAP